MDLLGLLGLLVLPLRLSKHLGTSLEAHLLSTTVLQGNTTHIMAKPKFGCAISGWCCISEKKKTSEPILL